MKLKHTGCSQRNITYRVFSKKKNHCVTIRELWRVFIKFCERAFLGIIHSTVSYKDTKTNRTFSKKKKIIESPSRNIQESLSNSVSELLPLQRGNFLKRVIYYIFVFLSQCDVNIIYIFQIIHLINVSKN